MFGEQKQTENKKDLKYINTCWQKATIACSVTGEAIDMEAENGTN